MTTNPKSQAQHKRTQTVIGANIAHLPVTTAQATANLRTVLAQATDTEQSDGLAWYLDAYALAYEISGGQPCIGAGIIAALSPATPWHENVAGARYVAATGEPWHIQSALFNARAIDCRKGDQGPLTILRGPKVRAFYRNVSDPLRVGPVVIDRHAFSILIGRPLAESALKALDRRGIRQWAAAIYRAVARDEMLLPQELQAIVWLAWRRIQTDRDRIYGGDKLF